MKLQLSCELAYRFIPFDTRPQFHFWPPNCLDFFWILDFFFFFSLFLVLWWSQTEATEPLACELLTTALQHCRFMLTLVPLTPAQRQFSPFPLHVGHYCHRSHKFPIAENFPFNGTVSVSLRSLQRHSAVSCSFFSIFTSPNFLYN